MRPPNAQKMFAVVPFGHFAALVEQDHFVVTSLLGLVEIPDIIQPRSTFTPANGEAAWRPCSRMESRARLAIGRQIAGIYQQVHGGRLCRRAKHGLIVDHVNSSGAFLHFVGEQYLKE